LLYSRQIKLKIKLPGGVRSGRWLPIFVEEGEPKLYYSEEVNVAPQQLVLVVRSASEFPYRPRHHTREFRVLDAQGKNKTHNSTAQVYASKVI
jgi:hypothetical protein